MLRLDWCSHEAAKYAVERWHYSGVLPANKSVRIGVWEGGQFIGCIIFGWGSNRNMGASIGLKQTECAELTRVALRAHRAPVSRIVAVAIRILRRHSPGLRALFSYADPNRGHVGGIYQALGWIYTGRSAVNEAYLVDGKVLHKRVFTGRNYGRAATKLPAGARKVIPEPKHRYVLPLDDEMRARVAPLAKPYPKREALPDSASEGRSSAGPPSGDGGATPTPTLQGQR